MIITIDGPVAAGKTTVAREVAARLGFTLLDTGAIYRSVALAAKRAGVSQDDEAGLAELARNLDLTFELRNGSNRALLAGEDISDEIRLPEMSQGASVVSAFPAVREALLAKQRSIAAAGDVVAEGRDTGTVVFPDADAKFFVTADDRVRAERRLRELHGRGIDETLDDVLSSLRERDERDSTRAVAPLMPADDAHIVDTTSLAIEDVISSIIDQLSA